MNPATSVRPASPSPRWGERRGAVFVSRFSAAALAKEKKADLVTGDPEFKAVEKDIKVAWLK